MKNSLETQTGNLSGQNDEVNNSNLESLKEDNCDDNFNGIDSDYIHYFYKITNKINGKYYYGIHSTLKSSGKEPLYDGYWGSGTEIKIAIQEEGRENFEKEIIEIFETREGARQKEAEIVTIDLISDPQCYNRMIGGGYNNIGRVIVILKDHPEKTLSIDQKEFNEHPEKYAPLGTGTVVVKRKDNPSDKWTRISSEEYQRNKDQYITASQGMVVVVDLDENGNPGDVSHSITTDEFKKYRDIKYISAAQRFSKTKGKVYVRRKDDLDKVVVIMDKNDPRYLSGEYVGIVYGLKQSEETILKKTGEKNGSFGKMWITNGTVNKKIDKNDKIPEGWRKGAKFHGKALENMRAANKKRQRVETTEVEIYSIKDKKNITAKLTKIYFRGENNKLITPEDIIAARKHIGFWRNIAKHFNMSLGSLTSIISFYESLGYKISALETTAKRIRRTKKEIELDRINLLKKRNKIKS